MKEGIAHIESLDMGVGGERNLTQGDWPRWLLENNWSHGARERWVSEKHWLLVQRTGVHCTWRLTPVIPVPENLMSFSGFHGHQALMWCTDVYANKKPYPLNDENVGSGAQAAKAGGSQL